MLDIENVPCFLSDPTTWNSHTDMDIQNLPIALFQRATACDLTWAM